MFYEKLNIQVDIDLLRKHVAQYVFPVGDAIFQGDEYGYDNFGGWSLLSRTGDWREGWEVSAFHGHPAEQLLTVNGQPNYPVHKFLNLSHSFEHVNPTEGCQGYIAEVLDLINSQGFYPRRAQPIIALSGVFHFDHHYWRRNRQCAVCTFNCKFVSILFSGKQSYRWRQICYRWPALDS